MQFISQPFGEVRLGDFLLTHLADLQWTTFRAAIAFVKRSGTQFIRQPFADFSARATVRISAGVDVNGTSREGLLDLLGATAEGEVFVYRNNSSSTFHPKVYLFKSATNADLLVGSGNMTRGGLFTNYEASLAVSLDLSVEEDVTLLAAVEAVLDQWSEPLQGICYPLNPEFLSQLVASGIVRSEAQLTQMQAAFFAPPPPAAQGGDDNQQAAVPLPPSPFISFPVPQPPTIPIGTAPATASPADEVAAVPAQAQIPVAPDTVIELINTAVFPPESAASQVLSSMTAPTDYVEEADGETVFAIASAADAQLGPQSFIISVLTVDLPVPNSSPEITITKTIRDQSPDFWGWTAQFIGPDETSGQYRRNIRIRFGQQLLNAYLIDFPGRKPSGTKASADFRLGSVSAIVNTLQQEDDLVILTASPEPEVDYIASVVRVGEPEHENLMNGLQVYARSRSQNGTYRKYRYGFVPVIPPQPPTV